MGVSRGFSGDLGGIGLTDLFHNVASNRRAGRLTVDATDKHRFTVAFDTGRVVAAVDDSAPRFPVVERLVTRGLLDGEAADQHLARRRRARRSPLEVLVAGGLVDEGDAAAAVGELVEDVVCALLELDEAHFEFQELPADAALATEVFAAAPELLAFAPALEIEAVLMEAARRRDEGQRIRRVVGSSVDVFVPACAWDEMPDEAFDGLGEEARAVAEQLGPDVTVAELTQRLGLSAFAVCSALAWLFDAGMVRPAGVEELLDAAAVAEPDHAESLLRRALELEPGRDEVRLALAERLAAGGDPVAAAAELALLGHSAVARGEVDAALRAYRDAVALVPDDVALQERRLKLLVQAGDDDEVLTALTALLAHYEAAGTLDRGRQLLDILTDPDTAGEQARHLARNAEVVAARARFATELGDLPAAAGHWQRLGEALVGDDEDRAVDCLQRALALQPEDGALQERLHDLTSGRRHRRRRVRRRVVGALTAAALLMSVGLVGLAEWRAASQVSAALTRAVGTDAAAEIGLESVRELRDVADRLGWTRAGGEARSAAERLVEVQLEAVRDALHAGRYDEALDRCERLESWLGRDDLRATCAVLRERALRERSAAAILDRADRPGGRPVTADLEFLSGLTEGFHLDFLLARLPQVRDHEVRCALLNALLALDSPRSLAPAARVYVTARDVGSRRRLADLLATAARHRAAGLEGEWAAVYPELEALVDHVDLGAAARAALRLLRGEG